MKIMLDCSPRKIREYTDRYDHEFWQLRTPLTGYKFAGVPYGLDNGCFTSFNEKKWASMVDEIKSHDGMCKFVTLPDVVSDAMRTNELFELYAARTNGVPRALVLQDGIQNVPINWRLVTGGVFVGGSDSFKISPYAINACKTAKMLGKWVHVGRVNTADRVNSWLGLADSIDGSGISKYDHMLENVLTAIADNNQQHEMAV